jgi:hypothetical protein
VLLAISERTAQSVETFTPQVSNVITALVNYLIKNDIPL